VTITSSTGSPYKAGDVLTCAADGVNPTYEWSGTNGGVSFNATSNTVTLEEGEFCLICTATVSSSDTNCSACAFLCDSAEGKYQKQHTNLVTILASPLYFVNPDSLVVGSYRKSYS